jgi:hypothetical protein
VGIRKIFVGLSLKGSRVISAFEAVFRGRFRIRKVFDSIRCLVVIPKYVKISYMNKYVLKII